MPRPINLSSKIKEGLPPELVDFLRQAGAAAQRRGFGLYLVGGVVRDLLMGRSNLDLDLVVEGDAIALAGELARSRNGKVTAHTRFGTATVRWDKWRADLAMARSETYAKPGALPAVKPGNIDSDLFRRDFTINAMAVVLDPGGYGRLIDPYRGREDLERRLIRVLHDRSFIDDATRIWRAVRYEQRLDFRIEPETLRLLKRDIPMLDAVSGDRIRHELELVLKEDSPEKALRRAGELGVLARLSLKADKSLSGMFESTRESESSPSTALYLALLFYPMTIEECEKTIGYLRLSKPAARVLRDTISLKSNLMSLADPQLAPSAIYSLLSGYSPTAIAANLLADHSVIASGHMRLFLGKLRHVQPVLTGDDLKKIGVAQGPRIKEMLERLRKARLDGEVASRRDEEKLVREWLKA